MRQRWPAKLWIVRHGQSAGNVARDAADAAGHSIIDLDVRDVDVPLSELGHRQADALGHWFAALPEEERPEVVLTSPYVRARQTAEAICAAGGSVPGAKAPLQDERLREREFGLIDRLTSRGLEELYPEQAKVRAALGKFYYRPPGGESWVDVALRIRSLRDSLAREHLDKRVLLVTHEVVIVVWRYLVEHLDEAAALALSRDHPLPNCSLTRYVRAPDNDLDLDVEAWTAPLDVSHVQVT
ncbi:MAG: histidine phosphatase family protein, partial [Allosphingosinicella sp.]